MQPALLKITVLGKIFLVWLWILQYMLYMSFPSFITRKPVKFCLEIFWRFTPCMPMERGLSVMGDYQCSYTSALSHVGFWDLLGLRSGGIVLYNHLSGRLKTKRRLSKHVYVIRHIYVLTAHNWQKWKRVFLTCPCHKIYRDEAVGLKSCKYTWKITIFMKMWNLGQYHENLIFCQ